MAVSLHLNVGPAVLPDFMSGALVCCALAWPTMAETATLHRAVREMEADVVRQTLKSSPNIVANFREEWPQLDWDQLASLAQSKRRPSLGTLHKRLQQRGSAARIGNGLAHKELFGISAELPPGTTQLSIDQLCKLVRSETTHAHSSNVEKHVWRACLPINLFRGDARAFAQDPTALALAEHAISRGWDAGLSLREKQFLYMPLIHSQVLADVKRCIALMHTAGHAAGEAFAERHATVIARFGRYPARNAALQRETTPEEDAFLNENPYGF